MNEMKLPSLNTNHNYNNNNNNNNNHVNVNGNGNGNGIMMNNKTSYNTSDHNYGKQHHWIKLVVVISTIILYIITVSFNSLQSIAYSPNAST